MARYWLALGRFRVLAEHGLKIVEGLLVLAESEVGHGPSQPGVEVVGLGLERLLRTLQGRLAPVRVGCGLPASLTATSMSNWSLRFAWFCSKFPRTGRDAV